MPQNAGMIRRGSSSDDFEIWRRIAGPQPGLFIPSTISPETVRIGPWFLLYTRASDLEPVADPAARFGDLLRSGGCIDAVGTLALINNYLAISPSTPETHQKLAPFLSPAPLARLASVDQEHPVDPPNIRVIFNRIACLVAIKLLLLKQDEWPSSAAIGVEGVGEFALLTNNMLKKESATTTAPADDVLLFEFLSNWDISNRADVALSMARTDRMIRDHLRGSNSRIAALRDSLGIDADSFDGCSLGRASGVDVLHLQRHVGCECRTGFGGFPRVERRRVACDFCGARDSLSRRTFAGRESFRGRGSRIVRQRLSNEVDRAA